MSPGIYDNVFMKKSINIVNRLDEVNGIVAACNGITMSFEQAYELARFYYDFQDTNALIADAEVMAGEDLSGLREIAISLKAETTTLLNNIGRLDGITMPYFKRLLMNLTLTGNGTAS